MRNLAARLDALEAKNNRGRLILIAKEWDEDEHAAACRKGYDPAASGPNDAVVFINTGVPR